MRISDWSSDVCSSDLSPVPESPDLAIVRFDERGMAAKIDRALTYRGAARSVTGMAAVLAHEVKNPLSGIRGAAQLLEANCSQADRELTRLICDERSEEHTSELQSLMRISYAVFCLNKKINK